MTSRLDESLDLNAPAVLSYLAARLDAAGGLLGGLRTASVIARGAVTRRTVVTGRLAPTAATDPALAGLVDDTGAMYAHVLDIEIREDYLAAGAHLQIAFAQNLRASIHSLVLPPDGAEFVMLVAADYSPVGREVARIAAGSLACAGTPIFMPPELGPELRWRHDVITKPAEVRVREALIHLGAAGRLAAPALDVLVRARRSELAQVSDWLRQAAGPSTLLARAVLWRAGEHDAAVVGFDVTTVSRDWLQDIGLGVAESNGERLGILGPSRDVPLM